MAILEGSEKPFLREYKHFQGCQKMYLGAALTVSAQKMAVKR